MSNDSTQCGGCFTEMIPLRITSTAIGHSYDGETVGHQCPNCGRTYLDEFVEGMNVRLDRARDYQQRTDNETDTQL